MSHLSSRRQRAGLRAIAVALISLLVLTFSTGRASAISGGCYDHGDGNDTARHYVCLLYSRFLHEPTDGEVNYWIYVLNTQGAATVATQIIDSSETAATLAGEAYNFLLDRVADPAGTRYSADALQSGLTVEALEVFFTSTDEAYAVAGGTNDDYVNYLYGVILDRSPSGDEVTYWSGLLTSGAMTRYQVASAFVYSNERLALIVGDFYGEYLGRAPDAGGAAFWSSVLQSSGVRAATIPFISSPEAYAFLSSISFT